MQLNNFIFKKIIIISSQIFKNRVFYHLPDGGTGDDDRGKGLAKSEWSEVSIVSGRSVSETCLEDEVAPREDGRLFGVDIFY